MDNKEFAKKLEERTREFAVRIIRLSRTLPNTPEAKVIRTQITKSGTSIGANYREANRARSKADFRNKIKICQSEASDNAVLAGSDCECKMAFLDKSKMGV